MKKFLTVLLLLMLLFVLTSCKQKSANERILESLDDLEEEYSNDYDAFQEQISEKDVKYQKLLNTLEDHVLISHEDFNKLIDNLYNLGDYFEGDTISFEEAVSFYDAARDSISKYY